MSIEGQMFVVGKKEEMTTKFVRDAILRCEAMGYEVDSLYVRQGEIVQGRKMTKETEIVEGLWLNVSDFVPVKAIIVGVNEIEEEHDEN